MTDEAPPQPGYAQCVGEGLVVSCVLLFLGAIATDGGLVGKLALVGSLGHLAFCALVARRWHHPPTPFEAAFLRFGAVPFQILAMPFAVLWWQLAWEHRWFWLLRLDSAAWLF